MSKVGHETHLSFEVAEKKKKKTPDYADLSSNMAGSCNKNIQQ